MGLYQIDAWLHLVLSVLLTGYVLFWAIMALALSRRFDSARTAGYLRIIAKSRWPHVIVPWRLRLPWPFVGWAFLVLLAITGGLAGTLGASIGAGGLGGGFSTTFALKIGLFVALLAGHALLTREPKPALIWVNFALTLAIVVLSAQLIR
jgi:hypothetical protein